MPNTLTYVRRIERKALAPEGAGTRTVLARLPTCLTSFCRKYYQLNGEMVIKQNLNVNHISTYSFRAECRDDVLRFLALPEATSLKKITIISDPIFPDVEVEVETKLTVLEITTALKMVEDGHIMLETLMACALKLNGMDSDPC